MADSGGGSRGQQKAEEYVVSSDDDDIQIRTPTDEIVYFDHVRVSSRQSTDKYRHAAHAARHVICSESSFLT